METSSATAISGHYGRHTHSLTDTEAKCYGICCHLLWCEA